MFRTLKIFAGFVFVALLAGCATDDPEDKVFFNEGWVHPDKSANDRLSGRAYRNKEIPSQPVADPPGNF